MRAGYLRRGGLMKTEGRSGGQGENYISFLMEDGQFIGAVSISCSSAVDLQPTLPDPFSPRWSRDAPGLILTAGAYPHGFPKKRRGLLQPPCGKQWRPRVTFPASVVLFRLRVFCASRRDSSKL